MFHLSNCKLEGRHFVLLSRILSLRGSKRFGFMRSEFFKFIKKQIAHKQNCSDFSHPIWIDFRCICFTFSNETSLKLFTWCVDICFFHSKMKGGLLQKFQFLKVQVQIIVICEIEISLSTYQWPSIPVRSLYFDLCQQKLLSIQKLLNLA